MSQELTSQEREELRGLLRQAFDETATEMLLAVLERLVARRTELATKQDISALQDLLAQLGKGQQTLQEVVTRLAEEQRALQQAIVGLTEGQRALQQEQRALQQAIGELTEGQRALQQAIGELTEGQRALQQEQRALQQEQRALQQAIAELTEGQRALQQEQRALQQAIAELTEGQRMLQQVVAGLTEGQRVLQEEQQVLQRAIIELTEGQRALQEEQKSLQASISQLAQAQTRTERALQELARQVGGLSETVGGDIEDIAYIVLYDVLKREFGWEVGVLERTWQQWDGELQEINIFGQAQDPARPGHSIWVVGEAKHNLTLREVEKFAERIVRAREHLAGEVFPVCFCYRARPEVRIRLKQLGIRLVFSYGRME